MDGFVNSMTGSTLEDADNLGGHLTQEYPQTTDDIRAAFRLPDAHRLRFLSPAIERTIDELLPPSIASSPQSQSLVDTSPLQIVRTRHRKVEKLLEQISQAAWEQMAARHKTTIDEEKENMRAGLMKGLRGE